MGLKKEETLQEIAQKKEKQRKVATDSFLDSRKEATAPPEKPPTYEEILKKGLDHVKSVKAALPQKDQTQIFVDRTKALAALTIKGVKHPEKVLQILEAENGNEGSLKYAVANKDYIARVDVVDNFKYIYDRARSADFIDICKRVENVPIVAERMHRIGARFSLEGNHSSGSDELLLMAKKISKIPSEQFNQVLDDLQQYDFLFPTKNYSIEDNLSFNSLVDFVSETKQITPEQKQVLDTANRIFKIGSSDRWRNEKDFHPLLSQHDPEILFANKERLSEELLILEQIVLELDILDPGKHEHQEKIFQNSSVILNNFQILNESGDLHSLAEIIKKGFSIGTDDIYGIMNLHSTANKTLEMVQGDIKKASTLIPKFVDNEIFSKIIFFEDLQQKQNPFNEILSISRNKLFESYVNKWQSNEEILKMSLNYVNSMYDNPSERANAQRYIVQLDNELGMVLRINGICNDIKISPDFLDKLPPENKSFWETVSKWRDDKYKWIGSSEDMVSIFLTQNSSRFNEFYKDGKLSNVFFNEFTDFFNSIPDTYFVSEGINRISTVSKINEFLLDKDQAPPSINQIPLFLSNLNQSETEDVYHRFFGTDYKQWPEFFKDGRPTIKFISFIPDKVILEKLLTENFISNFSENEQAFLLELRALPDKGVEFYCQKLKSDSQITEDLLSQIKVFNNLFEGIKTSTSFELQKISDQLIPLLLESSQPEEALNKIKALFERNNLPDFGKKFRIFEILYLTPEKDGTTRFDREMKEASLLADLSPTLQKSSKLRRLDTIYKDLLKINIESSDISLKNYLLVMQEGQVIFDKIESQGVESLTPTESRKVTRFLNRLNVLYENSLLGRQNKKTSTSLPEILDIKTRITTLKGDLQLKDGQKIVDRVAEMFVKPLGYNSIEEVLNHMDQVKQLSHSRNLSNPRVQDGQLEFNAGDLLKAMKDDVIGYVLQNGAVAGEYLGIGAASDKTPFDTDTGMVLEEDLTGDFSNTLRLSPANDSGYGNVIIVVKNHNQFNRTDKQENLDLKHDRDKYELFNSRYHGDRHFGIRTGFPSTEIDAVILQQPLLNEGQESTLKREGIFFNIANNGFYIPVVNPEGKVIFTEADYNQYKLSQQSISENLAKPEFKPDEFIDLLKSSPYLKTIYEMSSGVNEGYTTEKHTSMVGNQFEKYFAKDFASTFLTLEDFRLMLSFHDIGKPIAFYTEGSTYAQHEYTKKVLSYALQSTGIQSNKVDTIVSLVDQDILGEYFKGQIDVQKSAQQINELSETIGVPTGDLIDILKMYYVSDAGSYTTDAGGNASLDSNFIFKHDGEINSVTFSEANEQKYQELLNLIA